MTDINIVKFDGKPIEKLLEVISKGFGTIYKPRAIRKEAEARAYEIELIELAKSKALAQGKEIEFETYERLQDRLFNKELKRQNNIDNVAEIAAAELEKETSVSDEPVSEDWTTRFFNIAEDISDNEMQDIWGRILAGEVKKPKSYSLRTLEFLKNLSKDEALAFVKVANLSLLGAGKYCVFNPDNGKFLEENFDIKFSDLLQLKELGLINSDSNLQLKLKPPTKEDYITMTYNNKAIVIERKLGASAQTFKALIFTSIATELLQLVQPVIELKYIQMIKKHLKQEKIDVKIGDIALLPDGQQIVQNIMEIPD